MHQQPIHQGPPPMQMTYAPQQANRQNYFPPPRGAPPRLARPSMVAPMAVNMPTYTMPPNQVYPSPSQVIATNVPLMFATNQVPVPCDSFQLAHGNRQQNHGAQGAPSPAGYYIPPPPPQSIMLTAGAATYANSYYMTPQVARNPAYQASPAQAAPAQPPPPQQQQQAMSGGGVGGNVGGGGAGRQKRKFAVKIVDPLTGKDVVEEMLHTEETASQSGDSSTSHTPQPQQSGGDAILVADFAARVAAAASEEGEVAVSPTAVAPGAPAIIAAAAVSRSGSPPGEVQGKGEERATPVVSALTNSPPVELHHRAPQAPALPQGKKAAPPQEKPRPPRRSPSPSEEPAPPPVPVPVPAPVLAPAPAPAPVLSPAPVPIPVPASITIPVAIAVPVPVPAPQAPRSVRPTPVPVPTSIPTPTPTLSSAPPSLEFCENFETKPSQAAVAVAAPQPEEEKRPNGDAHHEPIDTKASQRQKSKKQSKMRDLNRKGVEKEGTEMDAFLSTQTEDERRRTADPDAIQEVAVAAAVAAASSTVQEEPPPVTAPTPPASPPPPPTPEERPPTPLSPSSIPDATIEINDEDYTRVKEEYEEEEEEEPMEEDEEEVEDDETDSMVEAKNQENSKVSGLPPASKVIETQIIERSIPALKYNYKDGQWSPLNTEGKKVYERDFLLDLRNNPLSSRKPDINSDCEIFVKDRDISNNNRRSMHTSGFNSIGISKSRNSFVPEFFQSSPSQRGGLSQKGRGSQQGNRASISNRKAHPTYSLKDDIKLRETENAWKPTRMVPSDNLTEEEINTQNLYKKVRGILNRLTPQKFDTLVSQVQALPIDSYKRLSGVMDLVFEKAVDEPSFSKAYAEMCRILGKLQVPQESPAEQAESDKPPSQVQMVNFRKLLINRCQTEFEKNKAAELDAERKLAEIKSTKDPEKKRELQLIFEDQERKIRVKSVGLVRFIGELFKLTMLTPNIMHGCVRQLIARIDEESLECLCKLLMTIGKELEKQSQSNKMFEQDWNSYFDKMAKLAQKREDSKVSSRVRFMLQDVIELRANRWVPRRDENNPKTIEQIQKEAERETIENAALLAAAPRKHDSREDRRRNQRGGGGGGNQNEDGWQSVPAGKSYRGSYLDTGKLQQMKNTEQELLGSSNQFGRWCSGASIKRDTKSLIDNNAYSVLAPQDDRKSSLINTRGPNKMTPSPSLEKERAFQGVKEVMMMDSSRNSRGVNRTGGNERGGESSRGLGSGPPSREGSRAPQAAPAPPPPAPAIPLMSEDEIQRKTKTVLEEFKANKNIEEMVLSVKERFVGENLVLFIRRILNSILDQSASARASAGSLIGILAANSVIQPDIIVAEFITIFEIGDDLLLDFPHVWKYLAELIVPILIHEALNFGDFRKMAEPLQKNSPYRASTLSEIMEMLIKEKGPGWIRTQWDVSKVQLKDFMPDDKVDNFIKENNCSFLFGQFDLAPMDTKISMNEVEEKIFDFLEAGSDQVFDHICEWVTANVGDRTKDKSFISALTKAVIRASTKNNKLNEAVLRKHEKLLKRFVDTQEDLELACLYGIQNLVVVHMESPQGVLQNIFQWLYDNGTISHEAFFKWKQRECAEETPEESAGKGVAVTTLSTFFVSLSEMDSYDEGS